MAPARIVVWAMPFSPMMTVSEHVISPRTVPFSMTVPPNVHFPSISEPSSMKAVRSPALTEGLPVFVHHMGDAHYTVTEEAARRGLSVLRGRGGGRALERDGGSAGRRARWGGL